MDEKPQPKKLKKWVKRTALLVVVVFLPQVFWQLHVVEGPSMWPMFNDSTEEEWVISVRSWLDREPEIYDVLVIEDPEDTSRQVVKRVVALPGDRPNIIDGDLRVRSFGLDEEWYLRRTLEQIIATRVRFEDLAHMRQRTRGRGFEIVDDHRRCIVPLKGSCSIADQGSFLKLDGPGGDCVLRIPELNIVDDHKSQTARIVTGKNIVRDLILTFSLYDLASAKEGVAFEIQHWCTPGNLPAASLSLIVAGDNLRVLTVEGDTEPVTRTLPLADDLEFRWVLVDDVQALLVRETDQEEGFKVLDKGHRTPTSRASESYLKLLSKGGSVILSRLDIDRDFHYTSVTDKAEPRTGARMLGDSQVVRGKYYLLGDNSPESRDSRHWREPEPYQVLGRPIFVVWPWSRMRVLP